MSNDITTLIPETIGIEVVKFDEGYSVQLVIIAEEKKVAFIPTDVWEDSVEAAYKKVLTGIMKMWGCISSVVVVIDSETKEIVEKLDLNELYESLDGVNLDTLEKMDTTNSTMH